MLRIMAWILIEIFGNGIKESSFQRPGAILGSQLQAVAQTAQPVPTAARDSLSEPSSQSARHRHPFKIDHRQQIIVSVTIMSILALILISSKNWNPQ